jgi:type II secretory pathway predicted ATPase ExeA
MEMYAEHYGLSGPPFDDAPDPAFYFDSQTHKKAMAYLGFGLAQGEGFIVLTGAPGTGKTTLLGHLLATIDHARLVPARLTATPDMGGAALLGAVAAAFGFAAHGALEEEVFARIEHGLLGQARSGKQALLLIDDADQLAPPALGLLHRLAGIDAGETALLQIGLFGGPALDETLGTPSLEALRRRVIATHRLEPLQADEVEAYIEHRLALVGCLGTPRFTGDAFAALHGQTGGVPRALNRLADRLLRLGAAEGRTILDAGAVARAAADAAEAAETEPSLAARLDALEARVVEQEVALRRALAVLIEWVEREEAEAESRPDAAPHGAP